MKPLLITDCDEVLLHMVKHFGVWLHESHDIDFNPDGADFANSMKHRADGRAIDREEMWELLNGFFPSEMERQTLVPHAREALAAIAKVADIVVLTNLGDHCRDHRIAQLATHGIAHRVETNQGGKGDPVAADRGISAERDGLHRRSRRASRIGGEARAGRVPPPHGIGAEPRPQRGARTLRACPDRRLARGAGLDRRPIRGGVDRRNRRRRDNRMSIEARLAELGLTLPEAAAPVAAYVAAVEAGGLLHISGQLPFKDGALMAGRLGEDRDEAYGVEAAQRCGLMLIAQMKKALGDLDRVERVVKLGAFVNSTGDFTGQPKVVNGASELMVAVFGEAGRHARSAVGVPVLPLGAAVEIDAIVAIKK